MQEQIIAEMEAEHAASKQRGESRLCLHAVISNLASPLDRMETQDDLWTENTNHIGRETRVSRLSDPDGDEDV